MDSKVSHGHYEGLVEVPVKKSMRSTKQGKTVPEESSATKDCTTCKNRWKICKNGRLKVLFLFPWKQGDRCKMYEDEGERDAAK